MMTDNRYLLMTVAISGLKAVIIKSSSSSRICHHDKNIMYIHT